MRASFQAGRKTCQFPRKARFGILAALALSFLAPGQLLSADAERGASNQKGFGRPASGARKSTAPSTFAALPERSGVALTNAIILVTPAKLDFGLVLPGKTATNTFLVENAGRGTLIGTASVSAPFRIESGGSYSLKPSEAQLVTVVYRPTKAQRDTASVTFTAGGNAVKATATGERARD